MLQKPELDLHFLGINADPLPQAEQLPRTATELLSGAIEVGLMKFLR